jgi:hypothetical protein
MNTSKKTFLSLTLLVTLLNAKAYAAGGAPTQCGVVSRTVVNTQPIKTYKLDDNTLMTVGSVQLISEVENCGNTSGYRESLYSIINLDEQIAEYNINFKKDIYEAEVNSSVKFNALKLLAEVNDIDIRIFTDIKIKFDSIEPKASVPNIEYTHKNDSVLFFQSNELREDQMSASLRNSNRVLKCHFMNHNVIITLKANGRNLLKDLSLFAFSKVAHSNSSDCK